jgi:hypothetical protein
MAHAAAAYSTYQAGTAFPNHPACKPSLTAMQCSVLVHCRWGTLHNYTYITLTKLLVTRLHGCTPTPVWTIGGTDHLNLKGTTTLTQGRCSIREPYYAVTAAVMHTEPCNAPSSTAVGLHTSPCPAKHQARVGAPHPADAARRPSTEDTGWACMQDLQDLPLV